MSDFRVALILFCCSVMHLVTSFPTDIGSDVTSVTAHNGGNETSFQLPVTNSDQLERREAVTQSALSLEQRTHRSSTGPACRLLTEDPYVHRQLERLTASGSTDLVVYELTVAGSNQSIVDLVKSDTTNSSSLIYYRPLVGFRMLTSRGGSLLRLPFDREILSFGLLGTNVHHLNVPLVDTPPDCYRRLGTSGGLRSAAVLDLLTRDLAAEQSNVLATSLWPGSDEAVCRQVIESTSDGVARFSMECCARIIPTDIRVRCTILSRDTSVDVLYFVPVVAKVAFLLFGPIILLFLFYRRPTGRWDFVVPLKADLKKTVLVKKLRIERDHCPMVTSSSSADDERKPQFTEFRRLVKQLPSEEIVQVQFRQMEIIIDRSDLLSESEYPLDSLFHKIYEALASCAFFQSYPPTAGCCVASCLFGSFSSKFLWLRLFDGKKSTTQNYCRYCRWSLVFRAAAWLVAIGLLVPLPYYARLAVYYVGPDWQETIDRRNATSLADLDYNLPSDPIRWLGPTHPLHVVVYAVYAVSVVIVSILGVQCPRRIEKLVRGCVDGFRRTCLSAVVRLVVAHLLLPVEKFGVILGLIVGAVYWPLVLPLCLVIGVFYSVPTLYVIGRLLIGSRPECLRRLPLPSSSAQSATTDSLTEGVTSFESCCFLSSINPSDLEPQASVETSGDNQTDTMTNVAAVCLKPTKRQQAAMRRQNLSNCISCFSIGIVLVVLFVSVLFMYAEAFGYFVEVVSMTVVGVVFSVAVATTGRSSAASSGAMVYVVLGAWAVFYAAAVYRVVIVGRYLRLSRTVFAELRRHLALEIQSVTLNKADLNIGYKYVEANPEPNTVRDGGVCIIADNGVACSSPAVDDSIEYHDGRLHWNIRSLVLFVDSRDDSLLMPRVLFQQLSRLDIPGCPGGRRVLQDAVGWCLGLATYLTVLGLAVRLAADVAMTSSLVPLTIVTLLLGAMPLFVYLVVAGLHSTTPDDFLSNSVKMRRAMVDYLHCWPVRDLSFTAADDRNLTCGGEMTICKDSRDADPSFYSTSANETLGDVTDEVDMTQVDLLVTIRDDDNTHNSTAAAPVSGIENTLGLRSAAFKQDSSTAGAVPTNDRTSAPVISHHPPPEPPSTSTNLTCVGHQPTKPVNQTAM